MVHEKLTRKFILLSLLSAVTVINILIFSNKTDNIFKQSSSLHLQKFALLLTLIRTGGKYNDTLRYGEMITLQT